MSGRDKENKEDSDEDVRGDMGFLMALLNDPVGRKVVIGTSFMWFIIIGFICGREVMGILLAAMLISAVIVGVLFRFLEIPLLPLIETLCYANDKLNEEKKKLKKTE